MRQDYWSERNANTAGPPVILGTGDAVLMIDQDLSRNMQARNPIWVGVFTKTNYGLVSISCKLHMLPLLLLGLQTKMLNELRRE
jgi:hypothetical protein